MAVTRVAPGPGRREVWLLRGATTAAFALLAAAAGRALVTGAGAGELRDWLAAAAFTVIGGRIAYRRAANPVGWLLFGVGVTAAAAVFASAFGEAAAALAWLASWLWWPAYGLLPLVLMLFPDGRLPARRWRWAAALAALGVVAPTVGLAVGSLVSAADFLSGEGVDPAARPYLLLAAAGMLCAAVAAAAGATALGMRWRRAADRDRRQLTWPLAAAVAVIAGWVLETLGLPGVWVVGGAAVPIAVAVAIVRHGLYDLGTLVSRTITYAILTALLGGLYVLVVVALTQVLAPATRGIVPEAAAALTVAAAFQTVRRAVQQRVDRRFNRARYDAARSVERFAARLRRHVELDALTTDLLDVIDRTVAPAQRSLWVPDTPFVQPSPPAGAPTPM